MNRGPVRAAPKRQTITSWLPWHALPAEDVISAVHTTPSGLTPDEAARRLARWGPNAVRRRAPKPWWIELLESVTEPLQLLLLAVGALYFAFGEVADAITILAVIVAVSAIEAGNEIRAKRAVAALKSLSAPIAVALRGTTPRDLPASELVVGDVVLMAPGNRVPADVRLMDSVALRLDESSLTGESQPVLKDADTVLSPDAELGDRRNLCFAGTLVVAGKGRGVVVATGDDTEFGRIARGVDEAREPRTPLQQGMRELSRWLVWVAIGFSAAVPALGVLIAGRPLKEMLLVGLTLAFATIPEELPILITLVLGLGAYRLARRNAIVRQLGAAETLGSVSLVATDKTGTLTQNRMRVAVAALDGREWSVGDAAATTVRGRHLLEVGVLANDAEIARVDGRSEWVGDPMEVALLAAAADAGMPAEEIRRNVRVLEEHPFDDARKRMSVILQRGESRLVAVKGAPEFVLSACAAVAEGSRDVPLDAARRAAVERSAETMAARGLRLVALAERALASYEPPGTPAELLERDLTLLGLVGLEDPPRPEAADSVRALRLAGVRVLMLTGDHPSTARAIAERVGIDAEQMVRGRELEGMADAQLADLARRVSVFARIAPEHKLRVVRALQDGGEVVAVTGDGVNDAAALREAAIGVAMGRSGSDVAREAADLILADDNFATVTEAVRTGRVLYANLRKAVRYYLAAKVALVSCSLAAVLLGLPVPFEPVQIIVMELFMDLGASATFVAEPPERDVMSAPPRRPRAPFMDRPMQLGIAFGGLSLGVAVLVAYLGASRLGLQLGQVHTAAFIAWMIGHVVLAAHMRTEREPLFRTPLLANRAFLAWVFAAAAVIALTVGVPAVRERLHAATLDARAWALVLSAALLLPSWWEPWKWLRGRRAAFRTRSADPTR